MDFLSSNSSCIRIVHPCKSVRLKRLRDRIYWRTLVCWVISLHQPCRQWRKWAGECIPFTLNLVGGLSACFRKWEDPSLIFDSCQKGLEVRSRRGPWPFLSGAEWGRWQKQAALPLTAGQRRDFLGTNVVPGMVIVRDFLETVLPRRTVGQYDLRKRRCNGGLQAASWRRDGPAPLGMSARCLRSPLSRSLRCLQKSFHSRHEEKG